jgi:hypothetical protein
LIENVSLSPEPGVVPSAFKRFIAKSALFHTNGCAWYEDEPCNCGLAEVLRYCGIKDNGTPPTPHEPVAVPFNYPSANAIATAVIQRVSELPDRTSPDDDPEAMLCDADELRACVVGALESEYEQRTGRSCMNGDSLGLTKSAEQP